jgi:hypothetical protein
MNSLQVLRVLIFIHHIQDLLLTSYRTLLHAKMHKLFSPCIFFKCIYCIKMTQTEVTYLNNISFFALHLFDIYLKSYFWELSKFLYQLLVKQGLQWTEWTKLILTDDFTVKILSGTEQRKLIFSYRVCFKQKLHKKKHSCLKLDGFHAWMARRFSPRIHILDIFVAHQVLSNSRWLLLWSFFFALALFLRCIISHLTHCCSLYTQKNLFGMSLSTE